MPYRSFCITVRPTDGLCKKREEMFIKWASLQTGAYGVIEKEGAERHLHLQLFFQEGREKGDVNKQITRIFERMPVGPNEIRVLRKGTRIAYNMDWCDQYLQKQEGSEVVIDNVPPDTALFFPSREEQERVKASSQAIDQQFHDLSVKYQDWMTDNGSYLCEVGCKIFLNDMMFIRKKMKVVKDPKIFNQTARALYHYVGECDTFCIDLSGAEKHDYEAITQLNDAFLETQRVPGSPFTDSGIGN